MGKWLFQRQFRFPHTPTIISDAHKYCNEYHGPYTTYSLYKRRKQCYYKKYQGSRLTPTIVEAATDGGYSWCSLLKWYSPCCAISSDDIGSANCSLTSIPSRSGAPAATPSVLLELLLCFSVSWTMLKAEDSTRQPTLPWHSDQCALSQWYCWHTLSQYWT